MDCEQKEKLRDLLIDEITENEELNPDCYPKEVIREQYSSKSLNALKEIAKS